MKRLSLASLALLSPLAIAQVPQGVMLGGFLDTYYAYDFSNPASRERAFTTQPARHNEFSVNLAHLEAKLQRDRTRGRLAFQFGDSVEKNTAGGPDEKSANRHLQEAYAGAKIGERTWIDAGIFLGNIGAESWISKDNYTYTRAMNLDYVPYYSSGVRLEHALSKRETVQVQVLNGWQNLRENNSGKAIGMQYRNALSDKTTYVYNNFLGDEEVTFPKPRFRAYHNFILNYLASQEWQYIFAFDIGHQSQKDNDGVDAWYATTATIRRVLNPMDAIALRLEYYNDRHQANVVTGTAHGFQVSGASLNFDRKLDEKVLWRSELRGFYSTDEIYPAGRGGLNRLDGFLVSSLAFWF